MPARSIRALSIALGMAAATFLTSLAAAQTAKVAVVKDGGAVMRAGDMPRFYRVTDIPAGTLVRVLGESEGWAQVVYPETLNVYVEASKARKVDDRTIELTEENSLLAPSALLGAGGSWCALYAEPLPKGTRLELVEEAVGIDQKVSKYLVRPPQVAPPRGFVRADELRSPTPEEVSRNKITEPQKPEPEVAKPQPKPEPIEPKPQPKPATQTNPPVTNPDATQAGGQDTAPRYEGVDTSLLGPMVTRPLPAVQGNDAEALAIDGGTQPEGQTPSELRTMTVNQLNQAFDELRSLPRDKMDAGLEELLAECRRSATALAGEPELVQAINQRIEWIQLRMKLRDQRREIQKTLDQADQRTADLAGKVRDWQSSRSYTLVGRVAPSTLYDGKRLPLMYRVESVDGPGFQRTIGYLRPPEGKDYEQYVGAVVGVIGQTVYDDALGVRIIRPERFDAIDPQ